VTKEAQAKYRQLLLAARQQLQEGLAGNREGTAPVSPDAAIGRLTHQDAMQSQQLALELERRRRQRLA
jgi:hypothetical protein